MRSLFNLPRSFLLYQASVFLLLLCSQSVRFALGWWALDVTGSSALLGSLVAVASFVEIGSQLVFSWMGDRYDKPRMIMATNAMTASSLVLLLLALSLTGFHVGVVLVAMLLSSLALGIRGPVQQSLLPQLVDKTLLGAAVQIRTTAGTVATFLGPLMGTALLSALGARAAITNALILLCIATFFVSRIEGKSAMASGLSATGRTASDLRWYEQMLEGIVALYRIRMEFFLGLLAMAVNFALYPFLVFVLLALVKAETDAPWVFGFLDACFGIGLFLGASIAVGPMNRWLGRRGSVIAGFLLLAMPMLACGVLQPWLVQRLALPAADSFVGMSPLFLIGGCGLMLINVNASVVRSLAIPHAFRTRILGAVGFLSGIAMPLGSAAASAGLAVVSPAQAALALGLVVAVCAPASLLIPDLTKVMNKRDGDLEGEYERIYPAAFQSRRA